MQRIECTIEEAINLISAKAGAAPINFEARTKVKLNKKHRETKEACTLGEVWKTARVSGWVNASYANAMEKETGAPYVPGETWHDAALDINDRLTPFSEDPRNGKLYLRVVRAKTIECSYANESGPVAYEQLVPFLPPPPAKEAPVPFRVYGLEGLLAIRFDGMELVITGTVAAETRKLEEMMAA